MRSESWGSFLTLLAEPGTGVPPGVGVEGFEFVVRPEALACAAASAAASSASNASRAARSCATAHWACTVRAISIISPAKTLVKPLTVVTTLAGTDCERAWLTIRRSVSLRNFARLKRSYLSDCIGLKASTRILFRKVSISTTRRRNTGQKRTQDSSSQPRYP